MIPIAAIFKYEWYKFIRNRITTISLVVFMLVAAMAIHTGREAMQLRLVQLDSISTSYRQDVETQWKLITDTAGAGKKKAAMAGMAVVINHRLAPPALWQPHALQTLCAGISDIQPFYHQVKTTVDFTEPANIPVTNPVRLFAGNFDLAFVWLYLLPLLVIAFCYPLYGEEKEAGTAALLAVQARSLRQIIACKLLFRILLISTATLLLNGIGILASPGIMLPGHALTWCGITQLYMLLWAALAWVAVSLRFSTTLTALLLTGCWLLAVMVGPAVANIYVAVRQPVPLRSELASLQRHESEEIWSMQPQALIDSFNVNHPQYLSSFNPLKDTSRYNARFVAGYYYLLEKRVSQAARLTEDQVTQRNNYFNQVAVADPVLFTQQLYNQMAGASLADYKAYRSQVAAFQRQWKAFLYPYQMADSSLSAAQFQQLPVFSYKPHALNAGALLFRSLLLVVLIALLAAAGSILFNRKLKP